MGRRKGKAKPGTWFTRELLLSKAYVKLSSSGKTILAVFLLKRDMNNKHEILNKRKLSVTYKELEALGMPRGSITAGITDLLSKGFLEIVRCGGAYQQDKTIYGLTDDWPIWQIGDKPVRTKTPGKKAGYHALEKYREHSTEKIIPTTGSVPIHTTGSAP